MSNKLSIVLISVLLAISIFLIYRELQAAPLLCSTAESYCTNQCWGDFSYDQCWQNPEYGGIYCLFWCMGFDPGHSCGWTDPTYGLCFLGPPKK